MFALMCLLTKKLRASTWVYSCVRLLCVPAVQDTDTLDVYSANIAVMLRKVERETAST